VSRTSLPSRHWTSAERLLATAILACLILTGAGLAVLHREMTARRAAVEERLRRHAATVAAGVSSDLHDAFEVLRDALLRATARAADTPGRQSTAELLASDWWAIESKWPFGVEPGPLFEVRGGVVTTLTRGTPAGDDVVTALTMPPASRITMSRDRLLVRGSDTLS
jgi:hypothetical protein